MSQDNEPYLLSCNDPDVGTGEKGPTDVIRHHYDSIMNEWITEKVGKTARFFYTNLAAIDGDDMDVIYSFPPDENGFGQLVKYRKVNNEWVVDKQITEGGRGHHARPYFVENGSESLRLLWSYITLYDGYNDWESKILSYPFSFD